MRVPDYEPENYDPDFLFETPHNEEQAIVDYHENMMDYIYNEGPSEDDLIAWGEANEYMGDDYDE